MKIVVFTGAGISAESGIMTFCDENALWREKDWISTMTVEGSFPLCTRIRLTCYLRNWRNIMM